jgi:Kef-type K+ transport system membrane component KefB
MRIPIVVGEIVAGILVGRSGFGWVQQHDPALDLLSEFGFVFLMFLSGMEIDFSSLGLSNRGSERTRKRWGPLPLGGLSFVITLVLSALVGWGLFYGELVMDPWMMALILSTTSLGVVVPVLKERGLSGGRYGQTLLIASLIADFATMLLITVQVAALSHGLTLDILLVGVLFVAFFFMYRFGVFFFNRIPGVRRMLEDLSHATAQIKVRAAFTMMLMFVVLSEVLGTEVILGAFLAGAIVSLLRRPEDAELVHQLESIGFGFFIPVFFIMVGVDFNLEALFSSSRALLLVPLLLLASFLVKFLPLLIFRLSFNWRETFGAGALLSARLSLIIAASAIGVRLGVISDSVNAAIILIAIITVMVAPMVFVRIVPQAEEEQRRPFVVVGAGLLGLQVAEQLRAHHDPVVVIDPEEDRIARAHQRGFDAVAAHADRYDPRAEEYLDGAHSLICVYSDVEKNYRVCERARSTFGIGHVVTRVAAPGEIARFEALGVATMNAAVDQAILMVLLARNPAVYELLTRTDDDKQVCEIVVNNPNYLDKPLRNLDLPADLHILAVRRDQELVIPRGDTILNAGDHLTLMGTDDCVDFTRRVFIEQAVG